MKKIPRIYCASIATETNTFSPLRTDLENFNIINCKGLILCPGFVDIKCHLRVPGQEHKENLSYASKSAASFIFSLSRTQ